MEKFDIYLTGVGGQGIGLLSETISRAADHAGMIVKGTDTHGLAQRGGIVSSHIRIGTSSNSCLIMEKNADMVIGMENHETMRGMLSYLKDNGILVFFNTVLQPLPVRLEMVREINEKQIFEESEKINAEVYKVNYTNIDDPRMQNIIILANIAKHKLIPDIKPDDYKNALTDLLPSKVLFKNFSIFDQIMELR